MYPAVMFSIAPKSHIFKHKESHSYALPMLCQIWPYMLTKQTITKKQGVCEFCCTVFFKTQTEKRKKMSKFKNFLMFFTRICCFHITKTISWHRWMRFSLKFFMEDNLFWIMAIHFTKHKSWHSAESTRWVNYRQFTAVYPQKNCQFLSLSIFCGSSLIFAWPFSSLYDETRWEF